MSALRKHITANHGIKNIRFDFAVRAISFTFTSAAEHEAKGTALLELPSSFNSIDTDTINGVLANSWINAHRIIYQQLSDFYFASFKGYDEAQASSLIGERVYHVDTNSGLSVAFTADRACILVDGPYDEEFDSEQVVKDAQARYFSQLEESLRKDISAHSDTAPTEILSAFMARNFLDSDSVYAKEFHFLHAEPIISALAEKPSFISLFDAIEQDNRDLDQAIANVHRKSIEISDISFSYHRSGEIKFTYTKPFFSNEKGEAILQLPATPHSVHTLNDVICLDWGADQMSVYRQLSDFYFNSFATAEDAAAFAVMGAKGKHRYRLDGFTYVFTGEETFILKDSHYKETYGMAAMFAPLGYFEHPEGLNCVELEKKAKELYMKDKAESLSQQMFELLGGVRPPLQTGVIALSELLHSFTTNTFSDNAELAREFYTDYGSPVRDRFESLAY